jgi:hypothetical protein
MQRHKIGTVSFAAMYDICELLRVRVDSVSTPVAYASVGNDLNGVPIEAGYGQAMWTWDVLPQDDYDRLLELQGDTPGASVYVRSSKKAGASGIEFANFTAIAKRPEFEGRDGLICHNVKLELIKMVEVP